MTTIFSKIIRREIPSYILYEDKLVIAFLDISQTTKGHTLIATKEIYSSLEEVPFHVFTHLFGVSHKIAKLLIKTFKAQGMNILNNNGVIAGQTIFHFHVHLIPRFSNKEIEFFFVDKSNQLQKNDYLKIQKQILENMRLDSINFNSNNQKL
ncbi:HIT family protein [Candidatus Phytoplasma pini]|uniref:Protein hit n=1 Tax=Candidatus Phytoplasma pini TaxID=267362 RepID=A0A559KIW5_9MOLU|nr:HIT family protein [Candidatus Phytoplasma pini]TVY12071.1 Protein hit [Candidatus Phytoplasma pini]